MHPPKPKEEERTMMFRRIYWVVENLNGDGTSNVLGVFTSIPDLMEKGLVGQSNVRLTLTRLDAGNGVLGVWTAPHFEGMRESLTEYIETGEFQIEHCDQLAHHLLVKA